MSPDSLPVKLRNARGAMDLTEAAARSGIPEERIREYETGARRPYRKTLKRLATTYGVSLASLAGVDAARAPAPRPPRVERQRRRRPSPGNVAGPAAGGIQVPIEVGEGGVVRVVIELVIHAKQADAGNGGEAVDAGRARAVDNGPEPGAGARAVSERREAEWRRPAERPAPAKAPAGKPGGVKATPAPASREETRDPLAAVRRAYSEFRHQKR